MKKLVKGVLFLALGGIILIACEHNETFSEVDLRKPSSLCSLELINEDTDTKLQLSDCSPHTFEGMFLGQTIANLRISLEVIKEFERLSVEIDSDSKPVYVLNKGLTSGEVIVGGFMKISMTQYSFWIKTNSGKKDFILNHNGTLSYDDFVEAIPSLKEYLSDTEGADNIGDYEDLPAVPWAAYAAGLIIIKLVDEGLDHCQEIIQIGIAACTASGKCFDVGFCSVSCYSCESD
jgi:hypothetical protein